MEAEEMHRYNKLSAKLLFGENSIFPDDELGSHVTIIKGEGAGEYPDKFNIFTSYADLMAVAEKLAINTNLVGNVAYVWQCESRLEAFHRDNVLSENKSMREAILQCVIAVMEGL